MIQALQTNRSRLFILSFLHFLVDFYAGLTKPLPEPTLIRHLGASLGDVMLLMGAAAIVCNAIQPLFGFLAPKKGCAFILPLAPLVAAAVCAIGLSHSYPLTGAILIFSAVAIGMLHPESMLAAHSVCGRRQELGIAIYVSGGVFGYSFGAWVGGAWAVAWGFAGFWMLAIPALLGFGLAMASGLHRIEGHIGVELPNAKQHDIPFAALLALMILIAVGAGLQVGFITPFLVRSFGEEAQYWGAVDILAFGLAWGFGSYLWSQVAQRFGRCLTIGVAQVCALPFLYLLLHVSRPEMAPVWGAALGALTGAMIPLTLVLGREAPGKSTRLRAGLIVGGAFMVESIVVISAAKWIDLFDATEAWPVARAMQMGYIAISAAAVLAFCMIPHEKFSRS